MASGRVHDRAMLDGLEHLDPAPFAGTVWRVTRQGRDAMLGSAANGRWSPGDGIEVLYTSLERAGALAEIGHRLSLEPVWPSRLRHEVHQIGSELGRTLRFVDIASLASFGVDVARYESYDYEATQSLAAAAHFLEFDGLIVPSARFRCANLIVFMDRASGGALTLRTSMPVDWADWRAGLNG